MTTQRTCRRRLSAVVAVALLLAACGDGDGAIGELPTTTVLVVRPTVEPSSFNAADATMVVFVGDIDRPIDIAWYGDPSTAYVATQTGFVLPVSENSVGTPVLDLTADLATETVEQGLLGLAFHPSQPYVYVNYTRGDGDTVIAEYTVQPDGSFAADSARIVMLLEQPTPSHNGGNLTFGPDGYLYIGTGDGGQNEDPDGRALDVTDPLGKILRIDPRPSGDEPYAVPADNPFVDTPGAWPEIWSIGLRNPWRFSFDEATGHLWVGDVGQNEWEEITVAIADEAGGVGGRGANFGWSAWEGSHPFNTDQVAPDALMPHFEYLHGDDGCAVASGEVYRGAAIPSLVGSYVFGDWCSGKVWAIPGGAVPGAVVDASQVQLIGRPGSITSVRAGPDGELYVVGVTTGIVHRIVPA